MAAGRDCVKPSHALQLYTRPSPQAFLTPYHWSNRARPWTPV